MRNYKNIFLDKRPDGTLIVLKECKVCRCKKVMATDFNKDSSFSTGYKAICKECISPKNKYRLELYRSFRKEFRVCGSCREFFPTTSEFFYRAKNSHLGLKNRCKSCDLNDAKKRAQLKLKSLYVSGDTRIDVCTCGDYFNSDIYGPVRNFRKLCVPCDRKLNPPLVRPPRNKRRLVA